MLYGSLLHQSYLYFRVHNRDTALIKAFVISILVVETLQAAFCIHIIYYYLISQRNNPAALLAGVWSLRAQPVLTGAGILISQSFYTYRVSKISRKFLPLVALSALFTLFVVGFAIASTYETVRQVTYAAFVPYTWLDSTAFACSVGSDLITTTVLIAYLHKSRTGIKSTDRLLDRLIMYTVNTGLLTSICNVISLVLGFAEPGNMIYMGVGIIATKGNWCPIPRLSPFKSFDRTPQSMRTRLLPY
ncbi:hypothetical protein OH77DRAFT_1427032 [Trametes cingulata]|nr:hypothetical protein OH77DRAFT_1427032 [Trametes cingulata]